MVHMSRQEKERSLLSLIEFIEGEEEVERAGEEGKMRVLRKIQGYTDEKLDSVLDFYTELLWK